MGGWVGEDIQQHQNKVQLPQAPQVVSLLAVLV